MRGSIKERGKVMKACMVLLFLLGVVLSGCASPKEKFVILSGSENETLEPILEAFGQANGVDIEMKYKGSVDIMLELGREEPDYDAVWPANSLWISLGDQHHRVKYAGSIMTSPVVFGIRQSLAEKLGFVGRPVAVREILQAIQAKKLTFMMTSASQSNSGASAYIGFLYALLGNPEMITQDDLHKPALQKEIRSLLAGINRSSGSSGWLKDLFLKGDYDAMVNYEALIIEANQELVKAGKEPLYVVYPYDGLVIADSPLGYINNGAKQKEEIFKQLQAYLLSPEIQEKILGQGRRVGFGAQVSHANPEIFNPAWGIDVQKILSPIRLPAADVIAEALNLYQTDFKKPSYTVFCLDYSGSMAGTGAKQLKEAMKVLLNREEARQNLLQFGQEDQIIVIPFSDKPLQVWKTAGDDQTGMETLLSRIQQLEPEGGTDIYTPAMEGLRLMNQPNLEADYIPAIVLLTDGQSNAGKTFADLEQAWKAPGKDIPVFAILFGDASQEQLEEITDLTRGRIFDGQTDLVNAFKQARGYN